MKTPAEIKTYIYKLLTGTSLAEECGGQVYKTNRPLDSGSEDIVISVLDSLNAQIQTFIVNVNIYTPAILNGANTFEPTERIETLSRIAMDTLETHNADGYQITLEKQTVFPVRDKAEYFINNRLLVKFYNA